MSRCTAGMQKKPNCCDEPQLQGRLRCLGSSSHLKLRFGGGYLLEVHAADDDGVQARLAGFVTRELGGQPLGSGHFGRVKFRVPAGGQVRPHTIVLQHKTYRRVWPKMFHVWVSPLGPDG